MTSLLLGLIPTAVIPSATDRVRCEIAGLPLGFPHEKGSLESANDPDNQPPPFQVAGLENRSSSRFGRWKNNLVGFAVCRHMARVVLLGFCISWLCASPESRFAMVDPICNVAEAKSGMAIRPNPIIVSVFDFSKRIELSIAVLDRFGDVVIPQFEIESLRDFLTCRNWGKRELLSVDPATIGWLGRQFVSNSHSQLINASWTFAAVFKFDPQLNREYFQVWMKRIFVNGNLAPKTKARSLWTKDHPWNAPTTHNIAVNFSIGWRL